MKRSRLVLLVVGLLISAGSLAYAHSEDGGKGGWHHYGNMENQGSSQCPVAQKFMRKAHFLLEHKEDIGLTDEQLKTIKELKLQADKDQIRENADREIFLLDLRSKLEGDKIDVEAANALIDKGFAASAAQAKANVEAYAKLKAVLTPDQVTKMKALYKKAEEDWKNKGDGSRS